jgi:hypothetical protein
LRLYTKGARMYLYKEFGTRRTNGFDGLIGSEVFDAFFRLGQTRKNETQRPRVVCTAH